MAPDHRSADQGWARIWVHSPSDAPWSFELSAARTLLGRGDHCDVRLADDTVSWDHLELDRIGSAIMATDLGSSNGTLVNGRPLSVPEPVRGGDILTLGSVRLELTIQPAVARRGTAKAAASAITLSEEQRQLARTLAAPFREPGAVAARPPTRAELASILHLSERTVQRRLDSLAKTVQLPEHGGRERSLLLTRRIIELGLDSQR